MRRWPVPYEDVFLNTEYGKVHVIVSGPEEAPTMLLLYASGVAGWSWKYNAEGLSRRYRIFAIDLIGDAGKSEFSTLENVMRNEPISINDTNEGFIRRVERTAIIRFTINT